MTATVSRRTVGRSSWLHLVAHQFHFDLRCFWRNTQSRFFTLALPVLFLVIFSSIFHDTKATVPGGTISESVYYVPGIITFGVIAATFSNLALTVVRYREAGIYKRRRATPVPATVIIAGRALVAVLTALAITVVLLALGWLAYSAHIPGRTAPVFILDVIVGAAVFCCLGFALAAFIKDAESAQPVVQAIVLPLCFISGVFIPVAVLPKWLADIGKVFPIHALSAALLAAYNTHTRGSGFSWSDLAVLGAWGLVGLVVALRHFSWLPSGG
ncbi:MAG TPA: ABC transporter permease [Acidimicrobiales bacterium]|nr:ABC transporter permease [Acidimicrobiales bacterium]